MGMCDWMDVFWFSWKEQEQSSRAPWYADFLFGKFLFAIGGLDGLPQKMFSVHEKIANPG